MRLATYNVEWFESLFDQQDRLRADGEWSGRQDVTRAEQAAALALVFRRLDADAVMVVEAPNSGKHQDCVRALEGFAAHYGLRTSRAVMGFANDTQQEIALLYDTDVLTPVHDPQEEREAPRFDGVFGIDLDIDSAKDKVVFSKPPLELAVETAAGSRFRMIGAHLKSKVPHGTQGEDAKIRKSIANRRKQLAQAVWLRRRIDSLLAAGEQLMVMGDLNDGPGLDEYERLFGRSSVEIVMGDDLFDPHARKALQPRSQAFPSSARFYNPETKRFFRALLDYVMISAGLMAQRPEWRIWHPFEDEECYSDPDLREALLTASDHFPVSLDLELT